MMVVGDEVEQVFVDRAFRGSGVAATPARRGRAAGDRWRGHDVAWLAVVGGNTRARRFYEKSGWVDEGDLPYEVTRRRRDFISPCRKYTKRVR